MNEIIRSSFYELAPERVLSTAGRSSFWRGLLTFVLVVIVAIGLPAGGVAVVLRAAPDIPLWLLIAAGCVWLVVAFRWSGTI